MVRLRALQRRVVRHLDVIGTVALATGVFVSTNIDDVFILLLYFGDRRFRTHEIVAGQYLGISALVVIALVGASVAVAVAESYVGLLGLVPITIGVRQLIDLKRNSGVTDEGEGASVTSGGSLQRVASVATITFSNGGDNIGIYVPVFAQASTSETIVMLAVFAVLVGVLCLFARLLISHRHIGGVVQRYGHVITPFVLIALGLYILLAHTDAPW